MSRGSRVTAPPVGLPMLVQRTCACGGTVPAGATECDACRQRRESGVQTKLRVGASHDPLEAEADRVADRVTAGAPARPRRGGAVQVQRAAAVARATQGEAPSSVQRVLGQSGRPLDRGVRRDMEGRFGHDFSGVRVHADTQADKSARAIAARAYTAGSHVVFARGEYAPHSTSGRRLIAHELTHVLQQRGGGRQSAPLVQRKPFAPGGCGGLLKTVVANVLGDQAHLQIQKRLFRRRMNVETTIPRASKLGNVGNPKCQPATTNAGYADVTKKVGNTLAISEIKPWGSVGMTARAEALHYGLRGIQSMDRLFQQGQCGKQKAGADDVLFKALTRTTTTRMTFSLLRGAIVGTEEFGPFIGDRRQKLRAKEHSDGAIGYWCVKAKKDKKKKDKKKKKSSTKSKKKATTKKTKPKKTTPKTKAPKAKMGAKGPSIGFGISILSTGSSAFSAGVGVSIASSSTGLATVGAGFAFMDDSTAVGSAGLGASIESSNTGVVTAGAGLSQESDSLAAGSAGAGSSKKTSSMGAGTAGAGSVEESQTAGAGVAGKGSIKKSTVSGSGAAGSGEMKDKHGEGKSGKPTDTKGKPGGQEKPADEAAKEEADEKEDEDDRDEDEAGGGEGGESGERGEGEKGDGKSGTGGKGGKGGPGSGTAGQKAGTGATTGTAGGTATGTGKGQPGQKGTPQTGDLGVLPLAPLGASTEDRDRLAEEAQKIVVLLGQATPAQRALIKHLAESSPDGQYRVPAAQWVDAMLQATAGISEDDLKYLTSLDWTPTSTPSADLRQKVLKALANKGKPAGSASTASGGGDKSAKDKKDPKAGGKVDVSGKAGGGSKAGGGKGGTKRDGKKSGGDGVKSTGRGGPSLEFTTARKFEGGTNTNRTYELGDDTGQISTNTKVGSFVTLRLQWTGEGSDRYYAHRMRFKVIGKSEVMIEQGPPKNRKQVPHWRFELETTNPHTVDIGGSNDRSFVLEPSSKASFTLPK